jgi:SSS family solute:Na+ symporter
MASVDWIIVAVPCLIVVMVALRVRRYVRTPSDFLAAGRSAGRYLVSTADGMGAVGLITAVGLFEVFYNSGFSIAWWQQLQPAILMFVAIFGFVIYRYRETRAMTMAQFFEMRYSRNLRICMGFLAFVSGIINFGIFPIVGARFFIYFCGLPTHFQFGSLTISNYALLSGSFLLVALFFVLRGGQLQIMVTDFVQGLFCGILFLVIAVTVLYSFSLEQLFAGVANRPAGKSMINPFDVAELEDFNLWYVAISLFATVYGYMSWQGNSAYNASALNPHEAKMGKILSGWRLFSQTLMFTLLGLAAVALLHAPAPQHVGVDADWTVASQSAHAKIADAAAAEGEQIGKQMTVPIAIGEFLPAGARGCFVLMMLFLMVSTDVAYLHSWGCILVQDVILPIRGRHLEPAEHLTWLRCSIVGVALFAYLFGLFFPLGDYIFFFMNITAAVYMGGSGAVIIGGLYWNRATTAGAWGAMIVGSGLGVLGLAMPKLYPDFPLNGNWMMLFSMLAGIATFVVVSLLTCREPHDMDRLLHRGEYAVAEDNVEPASIAVIPAWKRMLLGYDENFTRGDRFISASLFGWTALMLGAFAAISLANLAFGAWNERSWWRWIVFYNIALPLAVGTLTTVWFTVGGLRDMRRLFARLRLIEQTPEVERRDDGLVGVDNESAVLAPLNNSEMSASINALSVQSPS